MVAVVVVTCAEWAPLTPSELQVVGDIHAWMGSEEFSRLPVDMLVSFVRGYAYRADAAAASYAFLARTLAWRRAVGLDAILESPGVSGFDRLSGPRRAEFDRLVPSAIVGRDREGRLVVLERFFGTCASAIMSAFSEEEFNAQMIARREVLRGAHTANCWQLGKRVYKCVAIIDASGLGMVSTPMGLPTPGGWQGAPPTPPPPLSVSLWVRFACVRACEAHQVHRASPRLISVIRGTSSIRSSTRG